MQQGLDELSRYLGDNHERVISRWLAVCEGDEDLVLITSRLTRSEFRNNIPPALDGLCRVLSGEASERSPAIQAEVARHGHHRWKQGFSLAEIIRDWGHLNRAVIDVIEGFCRERFPHEPEVLREALDRVAEFMTEASSRSVRRFDELRQAEAASLANDLELTREHFRALERARGELLREAAHDIRGGLSAIAGASAVMRMTHTPDEQFRKLLGSLDGGVRSVSDLLDSLLALSRLESGAEVAELSHVDIAETLRDLAADYRPMAMKKGLALHVSGEQPLVVYTDARKVRRIAQNLLLNALQHTARGAVRLSWAAGEKEWTLVVSDSGPGMEVTPASPVARELEAADRATRPAAWNPASRARYAGEGVGLTIVKRLCDLLDAGIALESDPDTGSMFTIEFPRAT